MESEGVVGASIGTLIAPLGCGIEIEGEANLSARLNWELTGNRTQSYERGTSVNTDRSFSATLAGFSDNNSDEETSAEMNRDRYYKLGNTGYALVKFKTADVYLLRLVHNNALVSIYWQPNPDIPEDVKIIPFPLNPLYIKQGTLDGKLGDYTDDHYPQAHRACG